MGKGASRQGNFLTFTLESFKMDVFFVDYAESFTVKKNSENI
jgi:hypothetical protein